MKPAKSLFFAATLLLSALPLTVSAQLYSAYIGISMGESLNGGLGMLDWDRATQLTPGDPTVNGDGAVVQVGYFIGSSVDNLFGTGEFVALTGIGGLNSYYGNTSIGDDAWDLGVEYAPGYFYTSIQFVTTDPTRNQGLPANGTFLAIRFYNGTTLEESTHYNTVTSANASWQWKEPAVIAPSGVNLEDFMVLVWEDPLGAGATTIAIPEPATLAALFGLAGLGLALLRRR